MSEPEANDNLDALNRLRALPRGTQVDSRIAAIQSLLGEKELFKTLKKLRWPEGIICPRCRSTNVVRRESPGNADDQRHYYECLNCKGRGVMSLFDDLTGLPIGSLAGLRQSILCWYLLGFCSLAQIAKVLGLSVSEVAQLAHMGSELPDVLTKDEALREEFERGERKRKAEALENRKEVTLQETYTRSESLAPLKPGYKSRK